MLLAATFPYEGADYEGIVDVFFGSHVSLWAARLAVPLGVLAGLFLLARTAAASITQGRWIHRAGPFELGQEDVAELDRLRNEASGAQEEIRNLQRRLMATQSETHHLLGELEAARAKLASQEQELRMLREKTSA